MLGHSGRRAGCAFAAIVATVVALLAGPALAAVSIDTPAGWAADQAAQPQARSRAQAWAVATGYRLVTVASTTTQDDFAETLAVLEIAEPLSGAAIEEADGARDVLARAASLVVDSREPPAEFSTEDSPVPGATLLMGRWDVGDLTYRVALAPSGPTQSLVVLAARTQEAPLHRAAFTGAVDSMQGVTPPIAPFPRNTWRFGALVIWLLVAGGTFGLVTATADRAGDHAETARRSAGVLVVLSLVAGVAVFTMLGSELAALQLARVSRMWMTVEVASLGAILGAVMWVAARGLGNQARVQSAPTGGVYAGKSGPGLVQVPQGQESPPATDAAPRALDLPTDTGDAQLEGHSHEAASLQSASIYEGVDEDMKTRVAHVGNADAASEVRPGARRPPPPPGARPGAIRERAPAHQASFRDGRYNITKNDED
jgi:hypothetical protein